MCKRKLVGSRHCSTWHILQNNKNVQMSKSTYPLTPAASSHFFGPGGELHLWAPIICWTTFNAILTRNECRLSFERKLVLGTPQMVRNAFPAFSEGTHEFPYLLRTWKVLIFISHFQEFKFSESFGSILGEWGSLRTWALRPLPISPPGRVNTATRTSFHFLQLLHCLWCLTPPIISVSRMICKW